MDSTELITKLKSGEESAYKYLYVHYYSMLSYFAQKLVKDKFVAESIVGDVFYNIYRKRNSLQINGDIKNYLASSVRNTCLNYLNSQYSRKTSPLSDDFPVLDYLQSSEMPSGVLMEKELEQELDNAIERLPEASRKIFMQSRFEYKTYEQIAEDNRISVNTVKYHIKKALAFLRNDLEKFWIVIISSGIIFPSK